MTVAQSAVSKRPLSARQKKRYIAILNVALDLMERKGFDGVSVRELAELAEITPTTIYNVFGSKEALLSAALEFRTRSFMRNALDSGEKGFDGLIAINRRIASTSIQSNELTRSVATRLARDSTLFAVRQIYRTFHCNFIRDIQASGDMVPQARPEALACMLMMSHNAALNHWASNEIEPEYLSSFFDIETCNILYPVTHGLTKEQIDACFTDRMTTLNSIDYDIFFGRTHQLPSFLDIAALANEA